jgi:hypothetical protein
MQYGLRAATAPGRPGADAVALVAAAAACALAACYSPSLRDCTVSCAGSGDCAPDQVCGEDGMCAAPDMAGRCAMESADPPMPMPRDAAVVDSAAADAAPVVRLRVQVDGKGSVTIEGQGTCGSQDPGHGTCMYDIPVGVAQRLQAIAIVPDEPFTAWTSIICGGQGPMCTFTPLVATAVVAKFSHPK